MSAPTPQLPPIRIGISSCLLGQRVRYDSGHKHNAYITQTLGRYFELVPFCPEVAIGLGVPRPPIHLRRIAGEVRVVRIDAPEVDVTEPLRAYGHTVASENPQLSGYIFKKGSPSCGMERVKIYGDAGQPVASGAGMFARTLMESRPLLPVEEEGRLMDPVLRENFIERVFVLHRWQRLEAAGFTPGALVAFHTDHKFTVLAHDEQRYRELGRLIAQLDRADPSSVARRYVETLMAALARPATRKRHANVLMHVLGFFKERLDSGDKAELLALIDAYRIGQVPLIVPITLLRHHLRRHPNPYIERQVYLRPHPDELMLRNSL